MTDKNLVQVTLDSNTNREAVMARVDKKMLDLVGEKPSSRWDSDYWHKKYDFLFSCLLSLKYPTILCDEIINVMTNGNRDREWASAGDEKVRFIQVVNVLNTGIDFTRGDTSKIYAKKNGVGDPQRSRLLLKDIVLLSGATGSLGRCAVVNYLPEISNVSQDVNIIRLKENSEIIPEYFVLFMLSKFGQSQLERYSKGVSGQIKVTFDHIKSVIIPVLPRPLQDQLSKSYLGVSDLHKQALIKKQTSEGEYKSLLAKAAGLLREVIAQTENLLQKPGETE